MAERPLSARDARAVLGVTATATSAQVVSAFRSQAKAVHPDVSRDSDAAARFAALLAAYPVALRAARGQEDPPAQSDPGARTPVSGQRVTRRVPQTDRRPDLVAVWDADRPVLLVGPVIRHRSHSKPDVEGWGRP
jgi:hypothetical protein